MNGRPLLVTDLGPMPYARALDEQTTRVERLKQDPTGASHLLLVEHPRVITIGRSGSADNLLLPEALLIEKGFEIFKVSRGGDVTYHGPGQVVGYPIMHLGNFKKDIHLFMRNLEEVILRTVSDWGIEARRWEGRTGVWVGDDKLASIGVAVTRWTTYHGWALNVNVELDDFKLINPCGFTDINMTSMDALLGEAVDQEKVKQSLVRHLCDVFSIDEVRWTDTTSETT